MLFALKWMELEIIMLCEIGHAQKNGSHLFSDQQGSFSGGIGLIEEAGNGPLQVHACQAESGSGRKGPLWPLLLPSTSPGSSLPI
jgi:hypothetical protein